MTRHIRNVTARKRKPRITIFEEPKTNGHHRAKWWRQRIAKMTAEQLAEATGFSVEAIYQFERGFSGSGKNTTPIDPRAFQRYKLVCAGVTRRDVFDWN